MPSRRLLLAQLLLLELSLSGCNPDQSTLPERLTVGIVTYDAGARSVEKYEGFKEYLADQTNTDLKIHPMSQAAEVDVWGWNET
jgi:phosphonate transport system substrate-binding protein